MMEDIWTVRDVPSYVPLKEVSALGDAFNYWTEPAASSFDIRAATYLTDKLKEPSQDAVYRAVGCVFYLSSSTLGQYCPVPL